MDEGTGEVKRRPPKTLVGELARKTPAHPGGPLKDKAQRGGSEHMPLETRNDSMAATSSRRWGPLTMALLLWE